MIDIIANLHFINMALVLTASVVAGVWGLILYFTKRAMSRPWRISLITTAVLGALQGLIGITLVALGQKPGTGTGLYYLHYVYGGIVALAIPVALTYTTSGKNPRRDMLIFSIAALILAAAGVRAFMTGPTPH
jgi:heme A synthase